MRQFMARSLAPTSRIAGITLAETLIAGVLGVLVIFAGGFAWQTNTATDRRMAEAAKQRNYLNLAFDFMETEIRSARHLYLNMALSATAQCNSSDRRPILSLEIPKASGGFFAVTYAIQSVSASQIWQGPYAIYRCGPSFSNDGNYTEASGQRADLLIDGIASQADLRQVSGLCAALSFDATQPQMALVKAELLQSERLASLAIGVVTRPNHGEQTVICEHRQVAARSQ